AGEAGHGHVDGLGVQGGQRTQTHLVERVGGVGVAPVVLGDGRLEERDDGFLQFGEGHLLRLEVVGDVGGAAVERDVVQVGNGDLERPDAAGPVDDAGVQGALDGGGELGVRLGPAAGLDGGADDAGDGRVHLVGGAAGDGCRAEADQVGVEPGPVDLGVVGGAGGGLAEGGAELARGDGLVVVVGLGHAVSS